MKKFKDFIGKYHVFIAILAFLIGIIIVGPKGNFPMNDDWVFQRQVEAFSRGQYKISAILDPSFIAQGFMGVAWGQLFGTSFESLRLLTIAVTMISIVTSYFALKFFGIKRGLSLFTLVLIAFNPVVFISSFTFMTENYFLLFFVLSALFYAKSFSENEWRNILLGSLFCTLAVLVRQVGLVPLIAYLGITFFKYKFKGEFFERALVSFFPVWFGLIGLSLWPHYVDTEKLGALSGLADLATKLINPKDIIGRAGEILMSLHYFIYFLLPLAFAGIKSRSKFKAPFWKVLLAYPFFWLFTWLFEKDIFPVGNVFYIEALYAKSNFMTNISLFDNVVFTAFMAFIITLGVFKFFGLIISNWDQIKSKLKEDRVKFLLLTSFGMLLSMLIGNDFYERYLLPSYITFIFIFVYLAQPYININKKAPRYLLAFFVIFTVILQYEYFAHTKLRWAQAAAIHEETGFYNQLNVDGIHRKYANALKHNDYTGLIGKVNLFQRSICYVQKYTLNTDSPILKVVEGFDDFLQRWFENPKIYQSARYPAFPRAKKHLEDLKYNEEYFSPIYNIIGKKTYVGSWCDYKTK